MRFKSYHLRRAIIGIGVLIVILGCIKGFFEIGLSERTENWIITTLVVNALVLFVYMKKFQKNEEEENEAKNNIHSVSTGSKENSVGRNRRNIK
jgi:ABC-type siderophore export system fused ATPase/permease subunit